MINTKEQSKKANIDNKNFKYYLGLDLGIASIGWAVMAEEITTGKHYLHDFGVRIFDVGAGATKNKKESETQKRRRLRSNRRLIRRRVHRIERLQKILEKSNFISFEKGSVIKNYKKKITNKIYFENDTFFTDKDYYNPLVLRYMGTEKKLTKEEIYIILIHFAKKRGYLNKHLLYENEEKSEKKEFRSAVERAEKVFMKKYKFVSEAILKETIKENQKKEEISFKISGSKNILINYKNSKSFVKIDEKNKKENRKMVPFYRALFSRESLKKELNWILEKQKQYHPDLTNIKDKILKIIFEQRNFEVGPRCKKCQNDPKTHKNGDEKKLIGIEQCSNYKPFNEMIGKCPYYPKEKRYYKSSIIYSLYYFIMEISKFLIHLEEKNIIFEKEFYHKILKMFLQDFGQKKEIKKEIKKEKNWKDKYNYYFETSPWKTKGKEGISFSQAHFLRKIRKQGSFFQKIIDKLIIKGKLNIDCFNSDPNKNCWIEKIGEILWKNKTPEVRKKEIKKLNESENLKLSNSEISFLIEINKKEASAANVSSKYILEIIKNFLNRKVYAVKEKPEIQHKINKNQPIFSEIIDWDLISNPAVFRTINQTRKILKKLHKIYQKFSTIIVETAKSLKNKSESDEEAKRQEKNKKKNDELRKKLEEELIIKANDSNLLAYKLWIEQENKLGQDYFNCLYCNKNYFLKNKFDFLPERGYTEVDHIVPTSKLVNNSYENKVLVCKSCNQEKENDLPLQFLKRKNYNIDIFNKKILNFYKKNKKKRDYLKIVEDKDIDKINSRTLQDTHYLNKYVTSYVRQQTEAFKHDTKIISINGILTSNFRQWFLQKSPWGMRKKAREITHFHHAIDAMVIVQFKNQKDIKMAKSFYELSKISENSEFYKKVFNVLKKKLNSESLKDEEELKKSNNYSCGYIKNLGEIIENRIPVKLKKAKCEKCEMNKERKNEKKQFCEKCLNAREVPKLSNVQGLKEWKKTLKKENNLDEKVNLRYPVISYMSSYKLKGSWADENFGFVKQGISKEESKKEAKKMKMYYKILKKYDSYEAAKKQQPNLNEKELKDYQKKIKENYIITSSGNIILISRFYGIFLQKEENDHLTYNFITKIEWKNAIKAKKNKIKYLIKGVDIKNIEKNKNKSLLIKNKDIILFDEEKKDFLILNYKSIKNKNIGKIYINKNQLKFNSLKDIKSINSIIKNKKFKILDVDILGNFNK